MQRHGYVEEGYFNYSFSPIRGEGGHIRGTFVTATDMTYRVVGERRTRLLDELALRTTAIADEATICTVSLQVLGTDPFDAPFAMIYRLEEGRELATLHGAFGCDRHPALAPVAVQLDDAQPGPWPLRAARDGDAVQVDELPIPAADAPLGPWPEQPRSALVVPLRASGAGSDVGFLVIGLSARLACDAAYRGFITVAAMHVARGIANSRAYEQERRRAEALAEIDRAKMTFFSNVSHEFRTPLTLMLGPIAETLAGGPPLAAEHRDALEISQRNGRRLLKLVNTLLDFSRLEAGRMQVHYRPTLLAQATCDLASSFRAAIEKAGLTLTLSCQESSDVVYVDHDMWEKIVFNLLSNAFKFTWSGGITIEQHQVAGAVLLVVADTGIGISAQDQAHLFERFYRVQGARGRNIEGSGIGLALVHDLVRLHGGTVTVASEPGQGTRFTVSIPVGRSHLPAERVSADTMPATYLGHGEGSAAETSGWHDSAYTAASVPPNSERDQTAPVGQERILLVDDNADMRAYVARLLGARWQVVTAVDGRDALLNARAVPPDLVLTDIMMPVMDGLELLKALRTDERTHDIPVILLSARAGEEAHVDGLHAGADDYIVKPFHARELLARIATHLSLRRMRRDMLTRERERREAYEKSNAELEHFASVASHDLQEPLRMVASYLELLARRNEGSLDERSRTYLAHAASGAQRMQGLIVSLLGYAKVGSITTLTSVELEQVLADARANLAEMIDSAGAVISADTLPAVHGDRIALTQVLQNLISNAIKYRSAQAPLIHIGVRRTDDEVIVSVTDNGVGIEAKDLSRMFHAFNRLSTDATIPGTGLGLATCKRIIDRHGGRIWLDSRVGHGSVFSFSLQPAAVAGAAAPRVPSSPQLPWDNSSEHFRSIFMQAPASIAILRGPEHVFEFANPRYLEIVGRTSVVGKPVRLVFPEVAAAGIFEIFDHVYRSGTPFVATEYPLPIQKEGASAPEECFFSFNLHPLRDQKGVIYGMIAVVLEITELVRNRRSVEDRMADQGAQQLALRCALGAVVADLQTSQSAVQRVSRTAVAELQQPLLQIDDCLAR